MLFRSIKNFKLIKKEGKHLYGIRTNGKTDKDISISKVDSLEKISHPTEIRYFKVMKKANNALYGMRLEKIAAPHFIKNYSDIRPIDNALWGLKK